MDNKEPGRSQPAFILAQLGAHAANQFTERLTVLQLTPADAGILRMLHSAAGISQQELSERLSIHPSRLVAILDNLERKKLVERKPNAQDRRLYSLHLTKDGGKTLERIGQVAREHQEALLSALNDDDRKRLAELLQKVADQQGLVRGVHPGYQRMGKPKPADPQTP